MGEWKSLRALHNQMEIEIFQLIHKREKGGGSLGGRGIGSDPLGGRPSYRFRSDKGGRGGCLERFGKKVDVQVH